MSSTGKTISIIVLSYLLFGLFVFFEFGQFVVPVVYSPLFVFLMVTVVLFQRWKDRNAKMGLVLLYAIIALILNPFLWEVVLNQSQQHTLQNHLLLDVLKIIQWISVFIFFLLLAFNEKRNLFITFWLIPSVLSLGCLLNPPIWYFAIPFIVAGIVAIMRLQNKEVSNDYLMEILIGMGILNSINLFYWV